MAPLRYDRSRHTGFLLTSLLGGAALMTLVPHAALADEPAAQMRTAANKAEFRFDVAAKPLPQGLNEIGRITGLTILFTQSDAKEAMGQSVIGQMPADQALGRILTGTGYGFRYTNPRTVTLERAAATSSDGAMVLSPVTVEGRNVQENPFGPVEGYVATRSATATKTDTPIAETPQSISVVTAERMRDQGVKTVEEGLRYTAGVQTDGWGSDNRFDQFTLRGFDVTSSSVFRDGLRMPAQGMNVGQYEPYGLERLEVMRGPASVLYGQTPPGGLVNLVTKRPTDAPIHEVQVQYGSYDRKQGAFDFADAVNPNILVRATGLVRDADTQSDYGQDDRLFLAPAVTLKSEATTLTLLASLQQDRKTTFSTLPIQGTLLSNANGAISRDFFVGDPDFDQVDRNEYAIGYAFEHRFSDDVAIRHNARYNHIKTEMAVLYASSLLADQRTLTREAFTVDGSLKSVALDNQAEVKFETGPAAHTLLAGLDYAHLDQATRNGWAMGPSIDLYAPVYGGLDIPAPPIYTDVREDIDRIGLYGQDQIRWNEWIVTLGLRQDWTRSESIDRATNRTAKNAQNAFTYRGALGYQFDNGLMPYFSHSKSFEPAAGTDRNGQPFEPTTGMQNEIGVKYELPDGRGLITAALYDLKQQNVTTADPANPLFNVQTGEIQARGLELEGSVQPVPGLSLIATYTYNNSEISKDTNPALEGNSPANVPLHMASLWGDYTFQDGSLAGFGMGAGLRYTGKSHGDNANSIDNPSYTLMDAALHYELGSMRLGLNVQNLLDDDTAFCNGGTASCLYLPGRTVTGTLTYNW